MEPVELFAAECDEYAGWCVVVGCVVYVSCVCEYFECAAEGYGVVAEVCAEVLFVEGVCGLCSVACGYLVVAAEVFVCAAYVGGGRVVFVYAALHEGVVAVCVEEYGLCGLPVSSGASCFLEVLFDGVGGVGVYDEAYVGFVYAHAECVCCDDDACAVCLPEFLSCVFVGGG